MIRYKRTDKYMINIENNYVIVLFFFSLKDRLKMNKNKDITALAQNVKLSVEESLF